MPYSRINLTTFYTGKEVGNRAKLAEIQQAKDRDPAFQNLTEEERNTAMNQLLLYQQEKGTSTHVTNMEPPTMCL